MIVLDASVLVGYLYDQDAHHRRAYDLLLSAAEEDLGVSPLTLAEVLVGLIRAGRQAAAEQMLRDLDLGEILLPSDAARRLALLRVDCGLKLPDCCVLLAAETTSAAVATFDHRLAAAATGRNLRVYSG